MAVLSDMFVVEGEMPFDVFGNASSKKDILYVVEIHVAIFAFRNLKFVVWFNL